MVPAIPIRLSATRVYVLVKKVGLMIGKHFARLAVAINLLSIAPLIPIFPPLAILFLASLFGKFGEEMFIPIGVLIGQFSLKEGVKPTSFMELLIMQ